MVCVVGKRYNFADVIAALCMSLGLIWFTLADSKVAPNFNVTGSVLIIHAQHTGIKLNFYSLEDCTNNSDLRITITCTNGA